ncbi:hypothetical protein ACFZCK_13285 [Kitasatospora purpeofusca]|uniref:hypothetical protein n=1 Tax=Kitasatospora purpeofusca TaxID=67352 RepID=UPI0036EBE74D
MGELVTVRVFEGISRGFAADARTRIAAVVSGADALVGSLRIRVQEAAADLGEVLDRLADGLRTRMTAVTAAELPHLFFAQPGSGRGRVLYRRFDGGLGLIAAAS